VLAGHLHVRAQAIAGNILQLSHAALAGSPHDASIITITVADGRLEVRPTATGVSIRRTPPQGVLTTCVEQKVKAGPAAPR
jgi:hypothetical protein